MKLEKVKKSRNKVPSGRNLFKKIVAVLVSIAVFCGSYYVIYTTSAAAKDTVAVLRVKAKDGIPAQAVLTGDNIEVYQVIRKEYTQDMVLAERLEDVLDKYTTHYLRNGAFLHVDELTDDKPLKNEWIYYSENEAIVDKEILTIPFNYLESGGDILTPGDNVRIRVKYEIDSPEVAGDVYFSTQREKVEVDELLFDSIEVTDMLNSKSHSIYEVYREVLRYPESERQRLLKSEEFMNNIIPKALVLAATPEQVERYMQYKSSSKAILITILPREIEGTILDQLPTLEKEIETWLENQKTS